MAGCAYSWHKATSSLVFVSLPPFFIDTPVVDVFFSANNKRRGNDPTFWTGQFAPKVSPPPGFDDRAVRHVEVVGVGPDHPQVGDPPPTFWRGVRTTSPPPAGGQYEIFVQANIRGKRPKIFFGRFAP